MWNICNERNDRKWKYERRRENTIANVKAWKLYNNENVSQYVSMKANLNMLSGCEKLTLLFIISLWESGREKAGQLTVSEKWPCGWPCVSSTWLSFFFSLLWDTLYKCK
jgi:hypothetical protein